MFDPTCEALNKQLVIASEKYFKDPTEKNLKKVEEIINILKE